ncbi:Uncharacterised protein [Streptococcus pneumoniae]|nr:Uncharacterised protein [Streptococcus pneumoniae]
MLSDTSTPVTASLSNDLSGATEIKNQFYLNYMDSIIEYTFLLIRYLALLSPIFDHIHG